MLELFRSSAVSPPARVKEKKLKPPRTPKSEQGTVAHRIVVVTGGDQILVDVWRMRLRAST